MAPIVSRRAEPEREHRQHVAGGAGTARLGWPSAQHGPTAQPTIAPHVRSTTFPVIAPAPSDAAYTIVRDTSSSLGSRRRSGSVRSLESAGTS